MSLPHFEPGAINPLCAVGDASGERRRKWCQRPIDDSSRKLRQVQQRLHKWAIHGAG